MGAMGINLVDSMRIQGFTLVLECPGAAAVAAQRVGRRGSPAWMGTSPPDIAVQPCRLYTG